MNIFRKISLVFIVICFVIQANGSYAQNNEHYLVDTSNFHQLTKMERELLEQSIANIKKVKSDTAKLALINELYNSFGDNDVWVEYLHLYKSVASQLVQPNKYFQTYYHDLGYYYDYKGKMDSSIILYKKSLDYSYQLKDTASVIATFRSIGAVYRYLGFYKESIENLENGLKLCRVYSDSSEMAFILMLMSKIYFDVDESAQGYLYLKEAIKIRTQLKELKALTASYNDLGIYFSSIPDSAQKAIECYKIAYKFAEEINSLPDQAIALNSLGSFYYSNRMFDSSLYYQSIATEIALKANLKREYISMLANVGKSYFELNDLKKAEEIGKKTYQLSLNNQKINLSIGPALLLYKVYKKLGKHNEALYYYEIYVEGKKKIQNDENEKIVIKHQTKYEYEKQKALDDKENEKRVAIEKEKQQKQFIVLIFSITGSALVIILLLIIYRRLQITKKQKVIIEDQKEEVETQRDEIERQKHIVEEKHSEIQQSINYAKRIQTAILPPQSLLNSVLPKHFILYKPKDVVAGAIFPAHAFFESGLKKRLIKPKSI